MRFIASIKVGQPGRPRTGAVVLPGSQSTRQEEVCIGPWRKLEMRKHACVGAPHIRSPIGRLINRAVGVGKKDLSLKVNIEEDLPHLYIDSDRLGVAVGMLVENSILYTPEKGEIDIRTYREKDRVNFVIKSTLKVLS